MDETTFAAYRLEQQRAAELDRTNELRRRNSQPTVSEPSWLARAVHRRRGARVQGRHRVRIARVA